MIIITIIMIIILIIYYNENRETQDRTCNTNMHVCTAWHESQEWKWPTTLISLSSLNPLPKTLQGWLESSLMSSNKPNIPSSLSPSSLIFLILLILFHQLTVCCGWKEGKKSWQRHVWHSFGLLGSLLEMDYVWLVLFLLNACKNLYTIYYYPLI